MPPKVSWPLKIFWTVQVLLVIATGVWARVEFDHQQQIRQMPVPREQPLVIGSLRNDSAVVSDEDLRLVLWRLRPQFRGPKPAINHVDHALRCWGIAAEFADPNCLSGVELRELLLDHRRFAAAWGPKTAPFLAPDGRGRGLQARVQQGDATASHVDHTLAGLAEVGTPVDFPILTPKGEFQVYDLLEQSWQDFSLNQVEYEWSTLAYLFYLAPQREWLSREGQRITFDRLAQRLMRQRRNFGVCGGQHRLHTLAMLLRVDTDQPVLTAAVRAQVVAHLQDATRRLTETQSSEGWWNLEWPGIEEEGNVRTAKGPLSDLADQILVTGHVLEWWALAPDEVQPPPEVVRRAGQWLSQSILSLTDSQVKQFYPFLTHGGRALALWRGQEPAAVLGDWSPVETPVSALRPVNQR